MNLREHAKGQPCFVRLPGICRGGTETTVLAHVRDGFFGMGIKPPDICGVWACFDCHNEMDRRTTHMLTGDVRVATLEALCRQLDHYVRKGIVKW